LDSTNDAQLENRFLSRALDSLVSGGFIERFYFEDEGVKRTCFRLIKSMDADSSFFFFFFFFFQLKLEINWKK